MKDPLAPELDDPYSLLGLPSDATPNEAESAMDAYNERSPGREIEAIDAWDIMRAPARRLAVDIFRYHPAEPANDFPRVCNDDIDRLLQGMVAETQALAAALDFGSLKPVSEIAELSLSAKETT